MISEDRRVRVTAQRRQAKAPLRCSKAVSEIAAPVLESRTPTGTEPRAPDKVRMEAGRIGGIGNRMSGPAHKCGLCCASRWSVVHAAGGTDKSVLRKVGNLRRCCRLPLVG